MNFRLKAPQIIGGLLVVSLVVGVGSTTRGYIRESSARNHRKACIKNLLKIDGAVEYWALENNKSPGDLPTLADLLSIKGDPGAPLTEWPACPSGGEYDIHPVGQFPTCSSGLPGHKLDDYCCVLPIEEMHKCKPPWEEDL